MVPAIPSTERSEPKVAMPVRMATVRKATCHPSRPYYAKNLCRQCYMRQWQTQNNPPQLKPRLAALRNEGPNER